MEKENNKQPMSDKAVGEPRPQYEEPKKKTKQDIVDEEKIREAYERLKKYQDGKRHIDKKATENHEWWKGNHWDYNDMTKRQRNTKKPSSSWEFNSIINKVADMEDNIPKPNILPREADDVQDAEQLSDIIPIILERNRFDVKYKDASIDYINDGNAIWGCFWDNTKNDGMGDITIELVDIHNIFWKPGINYIQDSPEVFCVAPIDEKELLALYPEMEGHTGKDFTKTEYVHEDKVDTEDLCYVVDWYYKQTVREEVPMGMNGETVPRIKTILHYCKFCNDVVLYSSENEGEDRGFYWHGKFPFVFQRNFPVKDTPCGFGYGDIMRDPQMYIDKLDQVILDNAFKTGSTRFWVREDAGFDAEEFADWDNPFVHFTGTTLEDAVKEIEVKPIPNFVVTHLVNKIDELKETSGNRDFSQGSAAQGVTAASAIAALQEAGSKLARLLNKGAYAAFQELCYLILENIRQFYVEPRSFRVDDGRGGYTFIEYSNLNITDDEALLLGIMPVDSYEQRRRPVFDIQIVPEKSSPFSRAAQNETAKELFGMGVFNPQMAEPALVMLDMMDFEQKDDIKQKIEQNSMMMQQFQMMQKTLMQLDAMLPGMGIAQSVGLEPTMIPDPTRGTNAPDTSGTPEERAARNPGESTLAAKARQRAASMATPT